MLMAFFCMQVVYLTRLSLNVTVDAMKADLGQSWDSEQLVSSFFYGLLVTQIPGGFLASKFGCTNVITVGIAGTSVLTIFTPLAAYGGAGWIIAVRVLQGMFQGVVFPCLLDLWARWAPPSERTNMVMVTFVGIIVGTIKAMFIGEPLVESVSWESVFYIFGGAGCLWCVAWIKMIRKSPDEDRSITDGEKEFIMQTLGNVEGQSGGVKHPWKGIFTSTAVLACAVASFCQNWGIVNNLNMFPTFLKGNDIFISSRTTNINKTFKIFRYLKLRALPNGFPHNTPVRISHKRSHHWRPPGRSSPGQGPSNGYPGSTQLHLCLLHSAANLHACWSACARFNSGHHPDDHSRGDGILCLGRVRR